MVSGNAPPSPDSVPVFGHGLAFARAPFESFRGWAEYGDVVRLEFPGRSMYLVSEPSLIQQVLVENHDVYTIGREQRRTFAGVEDEAVSATTGERWRGLRRALHPVFEWDGIQRFGDTMAERTAHHAADWEAGEEFDLFRQMRLLTIRILGDTLLGVDLEGDEAILMDAADALVDRADPRRFGQLLPDWLPTPTDRRFDHTVGRLDEFVASVIQEAEVGEETVGSVLLEAHDQGDLTMAAVEDNLTALLLAGHDSAAVTLTYAWLELNRNPDSRTEIEAELEAVLDGTLPGPDDFEALERTRNVIRETLRLYPPTWTVNREAIEPTSLAGYEIPAGTQLTMPQWVLHRDERFWDVPETFDPSRWERESQRPEYAYFPFSGGPRHCIGMRFARLELVLALATMIDRVDLDVDVEGSLTFAPSLSLRPETSITARVTHV